jgi:hypothetical protein
MLMSDLHGPVLIRRLSGYVFVVPLEGWDNLSDAQRQSVMRHELEHYRRKDVWTSAAAQMVTLLHWFNPLAYFSLRYFEETAEWACDEAALEQNEDQAATFGAALISLNESLGRQPNVNPLHGHNLFGLFGRNVSGRIDRISNFEKNFKHKESIMKKAFLFVVVVLLFAGAFVHVRLVAQTPKELPKEPVTKSPDVQANAVDQDYLALLNKRVEVARKKFEIIEAKYKIGGPGTTSFDLAKAIMELAEKEVEFFKATGERENLLAAIERKRDGARLLFESLQAAYQNGVMPYDQVPDAELALAEAEYELKKALKEDTRGLHRSTGSVPGSLKPLLFQGKTFEQWVEQLQTELDPLIRAEAFRALAMFGANGRGKEAAEVIIDAVKGISFEYPPGEDAPFENMKNDAVRAFTSSGARIPFEDSLPILMERYAGDNKNEQSFVLKVFWPASTLFDEKQTLFLYDKLMQWDLKDPEDRRPLLLLRILCSSPYGKTVIKFLRETIQNKDASRFQLYFSDFKPPEFTNAGYLIINFKGSSLGLLPEVAMSGSSRMDATRTHVFFVTPRLNDFGNSLLELLREEGLKSENETIRATSQQVIEALEQITNNK